MDTLELMALVAASLPHDYVASRKKNIRDGSNERVEAAAELMAAVAHNGDALLKAETGLLRAKGKKD